jgi:hypothetical protein
MLPNAELRSSFGLNELLCGDCPRCRRTPPAHRLSRNTTSRQCSVHYLEPMRRKAAEAARNRSTVWYECERRSDGQPEVGEGRERLPEVTLEDRGG